MKKEKSEKSNNNPFGEVIHKTLSGESRYFETASGATDSTYRLMQKSAAGQLLTSEGDPELRSKKENSLIFRLIEKLKIRDRVTVPLKRFILKQMSESAILGLLSKAGSDLLALPVRIFGVFFFSLGMYSALTWLFSRYVLGIGQGISALVLGIAVSLVSIPLIFMKRTLSNELLRSRILGSLLFDFLGIRKKTFEEAGEKQGKAYIAFVSGMLCGIATYFVPLSAMLGIALVIILAFALLAEPEAGMICIAVAVPIVQNTALTVALLVFTSVSLLFKLISGKRPLRLKTADLLVLLFGLLILAAGRISVSNTGMSSALIFSASMLAYFLATTLVTTGEAVNRCMKALLTSAAVCSVFGVAVRALEEFGGEGLIPGSGTDYLTSAACFVMMALPVALACLMTSENGNTRFGAALTAFLGIAFLVTVLPAGAWIGLCAGVLVFLLFSERRAFAVLAGILIIIFTVCIAFYDKLPTELAELFEKLIKSGGYSSSREAGMIDLLRHTILCGAGFGSDAFRTAYVSLAQNAVTPSDFANNMFVQILTETGITGFLAFVFAILLALRETLSFMKKRNPGARSKNAVSCSSACIGGVISALVYGSTPDIWHDPVSMTVFWLMLGLSVASVRTAKKEDPVIMPDGVYTEIYSGK